MSVRECDREREVVAAIASGRWPDQCDAALCAHADTCDSCGELADLVSLMCVDHDRLLGEASVPSAGQVWWRAAIRARLEASQQAARPLSWLYGAVVACLVGLAFTAIELLWSPVQHVMMWASGRPWSPSFGELLRWMPSIGDLTPMAQISGLLMLGAAACVVLAPLALYLALSDD